MKGNTKSVIGHRQMGRRLVFLCIVALAFTLFVAPIAWAAERDVIRSGFVGGLTGRSSDLGIQGRNGATLAVDEINGRGGINGKMVRLITRDDKQDGETARKVDMDLIEEGVVAISGHMTSAMSEAALPVANEKRVPLIAPTTSTNKLTGIDDYFLRVIHPNTQLTHRKANYAFRTLKLRRMAIIYDLSNRAYSEGYAADFGAAFEKLGGGKIVTSDSFTAGPDVSFKDLARKPLREKPDGVLIIAGALDTAMLCQHIRMAGSKIPIFVSGWAQTPDLLRHGGPAVEGIFSTQYVDHDSTEQPFSAFRDRYRARFGDEEPTFAVVMAYEAVMVLRDALSRNPDPKQLKETILKQGTFQGLQGPIEIDAYGDAKRKAYMVTVRNGKFAVVAR